jgi:CDP-diacylglycerol--serine O-phosphatidyltransferase
MMTLVGKKQPFLQSLNVINVEASKISIIETTIGYREKLLELIKSAKKRIYITALYLQDDTAGQEVLHAIYKAKQDNPQMDVKIFVDFGRAQRGLMGHPESIGNVRLYRECDEQYQHAIDILGVPVKSREVLGVLHLKGFIFDDILFYSGASINDIYLQQNERYRYDRYHVIEDKTLTDSMVKFMKDFIVKSPAVKSLTEKNIPSKKQIQPAIKKFKKALKFGDYRFKPAAKSLTDTQVALTPLLGFGGHKNRLNQTIYELVKNTEEKIIIYTPYFNLPNKINKAVRRLLKQGKTVEIVVGDKKANDFFIPSDKELKWIGVVPYVYEANLRKFVKRNQKFVDSGLLNVRLWLHQDNSFHLKGI